MEITDVSIQISKEQLKGGAGCVLAQANIVIDGCFRVTGLRVVDMGRGELLVAMPSEKVKGANPDSKHKFRDIVHPINAETRDYITSEVLKVYKGINQGSSGSKGEDRNVNQ